MTKEKGIQIQNEQLADWKKVLKEEVYMELALWAMEMNLEAINGYDIRRGVELDNWIGNYSKTK
jgi:hypothetical protein